MAVSLSARRKDLLFEDYSGSLVSKLDYFLRITKEDGKTDGIYAGRTQILRAATDMNEAKTDDVFKVLLDLPSGDYQIGAIARWGDGLWESGIGAASQKVTVR